ncbi:Ltp family lipoprotein [Pseudolysinimonas yzui]|uniref:Putative host cell surface-exposed lipoprotein Ltp-like HTH region domain-containing protein n=1 Tax=Pseudolysinimonas yzui TaxID=2708254 RepID=A0A8J3GN10_9MICO|nr:Ltp family lipoprotein [Pseudolysinimonas yzui]GHF05227.1 hypothetical protein GCM10011600_02140 [Pseudolysinimonas yzui]
MSETPTTPSTPAGWYDSGDGRKRWWNGLEWTDDYQQPKKKIRTPLWVTITAAVVALVIGLSVGGRGDSSRIASLESQVEELEEEKADLRDQTSANSERPETNEPDEPEPAGPALTVSQQQAIAQAESYLRFTAFSRTGLIGQLEYEGFSTEDATFAVDNITVDWNAQAAASAESYLEMMAFSRSGLIDQLLYEGFTPEQAEYGVTAVGY